MIAQPRKNIMDLFIDGARRGFTIATTSLLPNVVMAFVIIQALKVTGLLDIVGRVCEPIMALWGLPGAAATVLLASVMSMGGGVGVCASLVAAGTLNGHDATILLPAIYLMVIRCKTRAVALAPQASTRSIIRTSSLSASLTPCSQCG